MLTAGMSLRTSDWKRIERFFPAPRRRRDGRGRPWAANRACVEGILWLLRSGARWRDLPVPYPKRRDLLAALAALAGAGGLGKHGGNCCANWSSGDTSTGTRPFWTPRSCRPKKGRSSRPNHARKRDEAGSDRRTARHPAGRIWDFGQAVGTSRGRAGLGYDSCAPCGRGRPRSQPRRVVAATTATRCGCDSVVAAST